MKYFIALLLVLSFSTHAADVTVQRTQGFVGNCDNATARTDGSPLSLSEIHSVTWYMYLVGETDPANYGSMQVILGGCKATTIVTKALQAGKAYKAQATTTDTDGRVSALSVSSDNVYRIQNANPNSPKNLR